MFRSRLHRLKGRKGSALSFTEIPLPFIDEHKWKAQDQAYWLLRVDEEGVPCVIQFIEKHQSGQAVIIDFLGGTNMLKVAPGDTIEEIEDAAEKIVLDALKRHLYGR